MCPSFGTENLSLGSDYKNVCENLQSGQTDAPTALSGESGYLVAGL